MTTQSFRACRIHNDSGRVTAAIEALTLDQLSPGEVVIRVHYSSVNYKDALAATGRGRILRSFPLIGGIDTAGVVLSSDDQRFKAGDEVLVTGPCYVSYEPAVLLAHGKPVTVPTTLDDEFRLRAGPAAAAVTDRTRAMLFSNPCNPTGAVMGRDDLAPLAELAIENDLIVISDEVYAEMTHGSDHVSTASLPGMRERTILLNGFSKADAMTGWRVGYACAPAEIIAAMLRIHAYTAMCVPTMGQVAAIEALRHGADARAAMIAEYDQRRQFFVEGLNRIGLPCFEPHGAFYAFPSIAHTGLCSDDFARALLFDQRVAAVPGTAFGAHGEGHLRCTYASSIADLSEALTRIERFLGRLERGEVSANDASATSLR